MIEMNLHKVIVISDDGKKILTGRGFQDLDRIEKTNCTPKFFVSKSHAKTEMENFDRGLTDITDRVKYLKVLVCVYEEIENSN